MSTNQSHDWLAPACQEKTRSDLEWDRLLEAIAARSTGPLGQVAARSLSFCKSDRSHVVL